MTDLIVSIVPSVELVNGQPMVSSLTVAEHFRKRHCHVLRDIEAIECSPAFRQSNFGSAGFLDAQGKPRKAIRMTRDGFMFLVMGYTGPQAARIKEAYIQRFNELEARLKLRAADLDHYQRCERELIRTQRHCIRLQGRVIRLQGRLLYARPAAAAAPALAPQADLFGGGA
jgi:Rha family phage regulatory protein